MNFKEAELTAIVINEFPKKADAIVCLEGDGQRRTQKALELFEAKFAPVILVSGGAKNMSFSIPASKMAEYLIKKAVPKNRIIIESASQNTKEQAEEVIKIVKEKKWGKIILVASAFHQPRAFLTFLKAMEKYKLKIKIFNAPTNDLWFEKTKTGFSRLNLFSKEFEKIKEYQKKGHLITIKKAIEYQKWKEKQP